MSEDVTPLPMLEPGEGTDAALADSQTNTLRRYGAATERKIRTVVDTCIRYGSTSIISLAGVPGTGKSYIGRIAAQRLAGDPTRVREIQFHPSSTYDEFVEGLRIDPSGAISVQPGLFLEWNDYALDDDSLTWVLLIEELTRANISAVLGELMTFIEDRSRPFTAVYSRRPVKVAPNLILLSTYNPTDRSALEVDNALLRRLRVLQFPPDVEQLEDMLRTKKLSAPAAAKLRALFETTRERHRADYEYQMPFGHGIFAEVRQEHPDLHELWEERIRHILRRPLVQPHPFHDTIRRAYPWTDPDYTEP
jgi:5-methylcytosine-specific restriction protein B